MAAPILSAHASSNSIPQEPATPLKPSTASNTPMTPQTPFPSSAKTYRILILPGDHVGPEVMDEALRVLDTVQLCLPQKINFDFNHQIVGGCSIDKHGTPITDEVLKMAKDDSDAVLFGSVGGPEWGTVQPNPESGLLRLRAHLDAFANVRPCTFYSQSLLPQSPLKPSIAKGTNFIVLRENCGGAYYGKKTEEENYASDTWEYTTDEITRSARVAAALAEKMGKDGTGTGTGGPAVVWSSDKANVLASGRLWRKVTTRIFKDEFPHIELKHQLADSLSMLMVKQPSMFNGIIHTDNTFGDMLSDQAGGVVGTLGVLPSASLCGIPDGKTNCNGIYEPVHGSAPDISGQGKANPVAQILSAAMMLRYSFNLADEAAAIERAVEKVLDDKSIGGLETRTGDLGGKNSTKEVGDAVCTVLEKILTGHFDSGNNSSDQTPFKTPAKPLPIVHAKENKKWEDRLARENVPTGPQEALPSS